LELIHPPDVLCRAGEEGAVEALCRWAPHQCRGHHVHLSSDMTTAREVWAQHGRPVVFGDAAARTGRAIRSTVRQIEFG